MVRYAAAAVARIASAAVVAVVCLLAVGCGGSEDADGSLADGRYYGYIRAVDVSSSPAAIRFDQAEFLTGAEANRAALEDGVIAEGETVPNDYYVRNPDTTEVELPVASDVAVTRVECNGGCAEAVVGSFEPFAESFANGEPTLEDEYRGAQSQYWVTVEGGTVVAIDEQYLP